MATYVLSKETARKMRAVWHAAGLSSSKISDIHLLCSMFTVFDPSTVDSTRSLKELQTSDVVRFHATPDDLIEQAELASYGHLLATIIDVASGPVATPPDGLPRFIITFH
jgi:hypothetical protein